MNALKMAGIALIAAGILGLMYGERTKRCSEATPLAATKRER